MKKIKDIIKKIIILIIIYVLATGVVDYLRVQNNQLPVFTKAELIKKNNKQIFKGKYYTIERHITISENEPINLSTKIKFTVLGYNLPIKVPKYVDKKDYIITSEQENCDKEEIYYYNPKTKLKVYTYCLESIKINTNKQIEFKELIQKDENNIDILFNKLFINYTNSRNKSQIFGDSNYKEYTNNGITAIKCYNTNIYLTKENITIPKDFCNEKDDTFKYDFEILDENKEELCIKEDPTNKEQKPKEYIETFYEDENNLYKLKCKKSDYIFLITKDKTGKIIKKIPLKQSLNQKIVTIEDLKTKGLEFVQEKKK